MSDYIDKPIYFSLSGISPNNSIDKLNDLNDLKNLSRLI